MQPHRPPRSSGDAARQARAWIDERHQHSRELVARLLRVAPEPAIAKALVQLAAGAGLEVDLRAGPAGPAGPRHGAAPTAPAAVAVPAGRLGRRDRRGPAPRPAPDGIVGPGARLRIREAFQRDPRNLLDVTVEVEHRDADAAIIARRVAGGPVLRLVNEFTRTRRGTAYLSWMELGTASVVGRLGLNRLVRRRARPPPALRNTLGG